MLFCGIDTSNYTTSGALSDEYGRVLANIKLPLPVKSGECGLRQSDAVFAHIKNLPVLAERLRLRLDELGERDIAAVAVSTKPRNLEDSYMPCFLSGVAAAELLAVGADAPLYRVSHQEGHIMAAYATSGAEADGVCERYGGFIAFHVSGGTTECLLVRPSAPGFDIEIVCSTADLNAGQAIDRTGVLLGLPFPCGPQMEKLALLSCGKIPKPRTVVRDGNCNLSGLENIASRMLNEGSSKNDICAYVFEFIASTLQKMALYAREAHGELPIVWAGGVMSNSIIKSRLSALDNVYFTLPEYSADNAVGVSLLCRRYFLEGKNN